MKKIYENKWIWKFYLMLIIFLTPLMIATVKWGGFDIANTVAFILLTLIVPYIIITSLIRKVVLRKIDEKDIININEMKIIRTFSYLMVALFIMGYIANSISILDGQLVMPVMITLVLIGIFLRGVGLIITRNKIYYGNRIIERKEIVRVEGKSPNDIRIYLSNGKDVKIRYNKVASYIEPFESI